MKKLLNRKLPKYKKVFTKEKSLESLGVDPDTAYLIIGLDNPFVRNNYAYGGMKQNIVIEQIVAYDLHYFELFKYLKKYQQYLASANLSNDNEILKPIKEHLLIKYNQKLKEHPSIPVVKFSQLNDYKNLIDYCFGIIKKNSALSLVIQKKIGYKYYENVRYY